jgi:hypothetical protein
MQSEAVIDGWFHWSSVGRVSVVVEVTFLPQITQLLALPSP